MIIIIDYDMGNTGSISNMLKKIGVKSLITNDYEEIKNADKIILPGVGSFDNGMANLKKFNIIEILNKKILEDKIPVLGICLGMQLMGNSSEEGISNGLGWFNAKTMKFSFPEENILKIPHMGWNYIKIEKRHKLVENLDSESRFYFVHSYHMVCNNKEDILISSEYGKEFTCAIQHENIMGVQFHPEKSHKFGIQLLRNFCEL